jgi:hypothetical protein
MAELSILRLLRARRRKPAKQRPGTLSARRSKPVPVDPTFGDPELAALFAAARARDWATVGAALRTARERETDADFCWLVGKIAKVDKDQDWQPWLGEVAAATPDDPLPPLLSGAHAVDWAWHARTGMPAAHVTPEQFKIFGQRLNVADELLSDAAELMPDSATPWALLLPCGTGLTVGADLMRRRFDAAIRRDPDHLPAYQAYLRDLYPRWHGSMTQMHELVTDVVASAPAGSPLHALVARVHIEHWFELDGNRVYIQQRKVADEIVAAARASVLHADFQPVRARHEIANEFAMALSLAGRHAVAADVFDIIGDRVSDYPWSYLRGGAGQVFADRRDLARQRR